MNASFGSRLKRVAVMIGLVGLGTAAVAYSTILDSGWVVSGVKASAAGTAGDGWIAFSNRVYYKSGGDSWEVFVVRPDGSGERRVTHFGKRLFDVTRRPGRPMAKGSCFIAAATSL